MHSNVQFIIYALILVFAFGSSLRKFQSMELSLKFICVLLGFTLITEIVAAYMAVRYRQNMMVYHLYVPVSLALIALYYNYAVKELRKYHVGYWVAAAGILAGILNTRYFRPLQTMNSNITLLTGVCTVMMAMISFYKIYTDESNIRFASTAHFWLSLLFVFYYCSTFFLFGLMQYLLVKQMHDELQKLYWFLWSVNLIFYTGAGVAFLLTVPQKKPDGR